MVIGFGDDNTIKEDCSNPLCSVLQLLSLSGPPSCALWESQSNFLCPVSRKSIQRKEISRQEHIPDNNWCVFIMKRLSSQMFWRYWNFPRVFLVWCLDLSHVMLAHHVYWYLNFWLLDRSFLLSLLASSFQRELMDDGVHGLILNNSRPHGEEFSCCCA